MGEKLTERFVIRRNGAFFRPNAEGYTNHVIAAGYYTRDEADKYRNVEGVTIVPLSHYQAEAERTLAAAFRLLEALSPGTTRAPADLRSALEAEREEARSVLTRIVVAHNRLRRSEITPQEFDAYGLGLLTAKPLEAETIERVARAMCVHDGLDPDEHIIGGQASGNQDYSPLWQAEQRSESQLGITDYAGLARAALAPTKGDAS